MSQESLTSLVAVQLKESAERENGWAGRTLLIDELWLLFGASRGRHRRSTCRWQERKAGETQKTCQ